MKNEKVIPFANPTKKLKDEFKRIIDEMPDEDFIDMIAFLIESGFDEDYDEEFDDDYEDFDNLFSGEVVNFRCPDCKQISVYPIEIINDIYNATKKEPHIDCYHCKSNNAVPIYYKTPNGKIFEN